MLHSISLYSTFHTVIYRAQFSLYSTFDVPGKHVEYVDITGRSNVDRCLLKWVDLERDLSRVFTLYCDQDLAILAFLLQNSLQTDRDLSIYALFILPPARC